jgi:penicillin amidase
VNADKPVRRLDMDSLWLLRAFTVIPAVLILLAGAGTLWIYFFVFSLLPETQSVISTDLIGSDVRVIRDSNGIPGIIGDTEEDVLCVLGYVMAQDRLWQMDFLRRASQGRLAEILGQRYLGSDHMMRTIRASTEPAAAEAGLSSEDRIRLKKFVSGVNWFIAGHAKKLPVEFSVLEYRPEPFTVEDVLDIAFALAWHSSRARKNDVLLTRILHRLGPERARRYFPPGCEIGTAHIEAGLNGRDPGPILPDAGHEQSDPPAFPGLLGGSVWAVGRAKTVNGKPLSACSVYQDFQAPGFWYRARLVAGDFKLAGAFIPGTPAAIAGSNGAITWACAPIPADDTDLYTERLDSDKPSHYWRIDRWMPLGIEEETYRVKGGLTVNRTILMTSTGPLISRVGDRPALSVRWTGRNGVGLPESLIALNRADSRAGIEQALRKLIAPCMNVVWTDEHGGLGKQIAGRIPIRPPDSNGIVPVPSWTGAHDWRGYIPFDDLPSITAPRSGFVVGTGTRPQGRRFTYFAGSYWNSPAREARISKLIRAKTEHYRETFQQIQNDTYSPLAAELTPIIIRAVTPGIDGKSSSAEALQVLEAWDRHMNADSAGAAVFALTYHALAEELFKEELGSDIFSELAENPDLVIRIIRTIYVRSGNVQPIPAPDREAVRRAFAAAVQRGSDRMSDDPSAWKLGTIHKALFRHPLTTRSRFLELVLNVGPTPAPGAPDAVDFVKTSPVAPYYAVSGVSLRYISEMTDPPQMFAVSPPGISAHFFSAHYKDQTQAWLNGRSFRDPLVKADIRKSGISSVLFRAGDTS